MSARRDPNDPNTDTGLAYGVLIVRGGEITVENNVFYKVEDIAILANEFTGFGTYRNNIFLENNVGLRSAWRHPAGVLVHRRGVDTTSSTGTRATS